VTTTPPTIEPVILPALHGWLWVLHGFSLFRAYAALWLLLLFFYWIALALAGVVPLVGPMLAMCLVPGISAGLMVACRAAQQGQPPSLRHIFEPFAHNRQAQFRLGLVYLGGFALALVASALFDGGLFLKAWLVGGIDARQMDTLRPGILAFFGLLSPVILAFWFAPALVHWKDMAPAKALFFSVFAGLRNWRAFLIYSLAWMFFILVVPALMAIALILVLSADIRGATVASFIIMPYLFATMAALVCSYYSSYAAVFPEPPPPPAEAA
jgi:hypothetical protein